MVVDLRKAAENMTFEEDLDNFQTPDFIIDHMINNINFSDNITIFEPTAGAGKFIKALEQKGYKVDHNEGRDFDTIQPLKKYFVIMGNPPFTPMKKAYKIFDRCFEEFLQDGGHMIMVMPALWLINSTERMKKYFPYILSITLLDRKAFKGSKIQAIIVKLQKRPRSATMNGNIIHDIADLQLLPTPL